MKKLLYIAVATLTLVVSSASANTGGYPLDKAPSNRAQDLAALQRGAELFVNYCLNCHGAAAMRYNRLQDIGLTDEQIKKNLLFTTDKVGDTMKVAITAKDAKDWFDAVPPDLSVIARAKSSGAGSGSDWLYTYLRSYYKDDTRPTGWNNLVFPNVGMPHVLWQLQGIRTAKFSEHKDAHGNVVHEFDQFETITPGILSASEYDETVADLVGYMSYMGEPAQTTRKRLGVWVLLYLGIFFVVAWRLNASYWKDVK